LLRVLPSVDLVLVSFADMEHMGALPYIAKRLRPGVKIAATFPVWKLGQMMLYDMFLSKSMEGDFSAFTLDDVDAAFKRFTFLR
jgi:cleavage and polyadenylation specificity factor subunit 2